ncbi:hypothetical protein SAMN05192581_103748 [Bacteroides ovatus]|uniref:Uncharacterized protein n=1 Tax=Bacteroides ovatus TaxID=28116 RepID=A0A1G6G8X5_BACOV|nr:hypothetical protein [Bacteroides ovatus]SDB78283.1 hypothetical protein SAMN05192581_103748 [Bacteroides ovatus]
MNTINNITFDDNQLPDSRYEILFCTGIPKSFEDEPPSMIQIINGADVNCENVDLKCKVNWLEKNKVIESISFMMPRDDAHLKDVFTTSPYGLIKKNRTGVGATTLELDSPRNSVVVVPTRTLAYSKAVNSRIEGDENKYKILYVGGKITGFNPPKISTYLADSSIKYKKFIVVANSLPSLLNIIGKENYKDYFLMVDEIDSYQYDCSYRPEMEDVIDYYFQFPPTQRCLVSATVSRFSNKLIEDEPVINVEFNEPLPRNIRLIHTDDTNIRVKKSIEDIISTHPNDKILVAYNSISDCGYIINSLADELKTDCAMLCSTKNESTVEHYSDITGNQLPQKISFMTCAYFVGIDITERFHLITVINSKKFHTVLSIDKLQQIAGRCRSSEGLLSETIIYSTKESTNNLNPNDVCNEALIDAKQLIHFGKLYSTLKYKFPTTDIFRNEIDTTEFIRKTARSYYGTKPVQILRQDIHGDLMPSFFNIDYIRIQIELLKNLYSQAPHLMDKLIVEGHNIEYQNLQEQERITDTVIEETDAQTLLSNESQRDELITLLREETTLEGRERTANILRTQCSTLNSMFLEHFIELHRYVPFETLVDKLVLYNKPSEYKKLRNYVLFWALEESHSIKVTMRQNLPLNRTYTGEELTARFNTISGLLGLGELSSRQAFLFLKEFCKLSTRTTKRVNNIPTGAYKILSYNPFGLDVEPLQHIPAAKDMRKEFRF